MMNQRRCSTDRVPTQGSAKILRFIGLGLLGGLGLVGSQVSFAETQVQQPTPLAAALSATSAEWAVESPLSAEIEISTEREISTAPTPSPLNQQLNAADTAAVTVPTAAVSESNPASSVALPMIEEKASSGADQAFKTASAFSNFLIASPAMAATHGLATLPTPAPEPTEAAPTSPALALTDITPPAAPASPEAAKPDFFPEPAPPAAPTASEAPQAAPEVQPDPIVPPSIRTTENVPADYGSVFIDPTDYSVGQTQSPDIVFSERSTGCKFTVGQGQSVPNGACSSPAAPVTSGPAPVAVTTGRASSPAPSAPHVNASVNVGPVSLDAAGLRFSGATTAAGREYYNRSVFPVVSLQAQQNFIFPLSIPAPITSLFGWRIHPISGTQRFHSGTDIGAPLGTPVLAAQAGQVSSADYAGGYGLMVVLRHDQDETLESRYAHLSQLLVQPGDRVQKGEVVGLVGSTGNSTGPHLHFELRQLTDQGWVAVNPDDLIYQTLANLTQGLNNPLQALNSAVAGPNALGGPQFDSRSPLDLQIPFRPAQPNAS